MWMTDEQVRTSYRDAVNQRAQIKVLAQLNGCGTRRIAEICGVPDTTHMTLAQLYDMARQLYYDKQVPIHKIAKQLGIALDGKTAAKHGIQLPVAHRHWKAGKPEEPRHYKLHKW